MILRDTSGQILEKGTKVAFPLSLGQVALGVVVETYSGLCLDGTPSRNPVVVLALTVILPADAAGTVPGLVKITGQDQSATIQE